MAGYIKLHRQIIHWEWYTDINTKTLFLHCLLMANHKDNSWRGVHIKQGSFVSSLRKLALETGLTVSQTRTSINKLISTQEIAQEPHTSMTIIKVLNYAVYQGKVDDDLDDDSTQNAQELTIKSQTNSTRVSKRIATNKNEKKLKNEKNDKKYKDNIYFDDAELNETFIDFIKMRKTLKDGVMTDRAMDIMIKKLNNYSVEIAIQMLNQSIISNWKDVYEIKNDINKNLTKQQIINNRKNEQLKKMFEGNDKDVIEEDI